MKSGFKARSDWRSQKPILDLTWVYTDLRERYLARRKNSDPFLEMPSGAFDHEQASRPTASRIQFPGIPPHNIPTPLLLTPPLLSTLPVPNTPFHNSHQIKQSRNPQRFGCGMEIFPTPRLMPGPESACVACARVAASPFEPSAKLASGSIVACRRGLHFGCSWARPCPGANAPKGCAWEGS
ncbi:MAG: hypothetical protein S4CHLAM102_05410 [Chlamydiia bacterium]|nr:hypothetical protein [Chlamydiia bacterium]